MKLIPKKDKGIRGNEEKDNKIEDIAVNKSNKTLPGGWKQKASSIMDHFPKQINPSKSVGVRLFLIFFVAIMFFVLVIGILSYQMAKNTIQNNAEKSNLQAVVQASQKMDIILNQYNESLQQVFLDEEMQTAIREASLSNLSDYDLFVQANKMQKRLTSLILSTDSIAAIYMVAEDKTFDPIITGNADQAFVGSIKDKPWYEEVKTNSKAKWISIADDKEQKSDIVRVARSFQSLNNNSRYIMVADIKVAVLQSYLDAMDLGDGSTIQLLTPDNIVITSTMYDDTGKVTEVDLSKAGNEASGGKRTKDAHGKPVLAVYNQMETSGWKLMGAVPTAQLTKDANGILLATYISAAVVGLIAILIGIWMVFMIARPLAKLKNLMEEGSRGNLNVRIEMKSKDEIGQLAASFNVMMEQISNLVRQTNHSAQDVMVTASELTDASNKTALSAKEIAVATEEIASGATSLASQAERGNELTDNITRQMESFIIANKEMSSAATEVEKSSQLGTEYLNTLLQKTNSTVEMVNALTAKVDSLKSSTSSVMKVLDVMHAITQQTNILSLNATIEAARAGAAGRGFMVVADEIRQLADQSKRSITMVGEITDKIGQEMDETVQALSEASPLFQEQIISVKETSQIFVSVQDKMEGFVRYLDAVTVEIGELNESQVVMSDAMSNVSAVAEQSSATSQEVASLSNEQQVVGEQLVQLSVQLENVSSKLKDSLSKFTV